MEAGQGHDGRPADGQQGPTSTVGGDGSATSSCGNPPPGDGTRREEVAAASSAMNGGGAGTGACGVITEAVHEGGAPLLASPLPPSSDAAAAGTPSTPAPSQGPPATPGEQR